MGGGSMIRAAVKANGIGLINSSLRSGVVSEAPISVTTRAVSRPISAIAVKSSDSVAIDTPSHETHCLGAIDDWEFAEIVEEIKIPAADPIPKNVFDAPPTIEEAKTATGELKDALEKIYVSSPKSNESLQDSIHTSEQSHSPEPSHIVRHESKVSLISSPSTPNHAIQAFKFLDQSPQVQGVVASIVSDPNVWEAVLQNPALRSYVSSQTVVYRSAHENIKESLIEGDICYQESPKCLEDSSDDEDEVSSSPENVKSDDVKRDLKEEIRNVWENIKLGVADMVTNLSHFFDSLFGVQGDKKSNSNIVPEAVEKLLGPSMMGVVVMVIVVVVLKRV